MRSAVRLATGPGVAVDTVTCVDDHRDWSPIEVGSGYRVVLVRRGAFRRMADGRPAVIDPTMAYLGVPGEEEHFAHPSGGDVCTSVSVSPSLWGDFADPDTRPARSTVYVDARLDLAHRRIVTAARLGGGAVDLTEFVLPLLKATADQLIPPASAGPRSARVARGGTGRVVDAARTVIGAGHPSSGSLAGLAELLGVSPYRLSRAFTSELGISLTHYRNRVRVGQVLDRLERGETSLALLAVDVGFADQAHLTRTVRRHVGHTPTALRRLLGPRGSGHTQ